MKMVTIRSKDGSGAFPRTWVKNWWNYTKDLKTFPECCDTFPKTPFAVKWRRTYLKDAQAFIIIRNNLASPISLKNNKLSVQKTIKAPNIFTTWQVISNGLAEAIISYVWFSNLKPIIKFDLNSSDETYFIGLHSSNLWSIVCHLEWVSLIALNKIFVNDGNHFDK